MKTKSLFILILVLSFGCGSKSNLNGTSTNNKNKMVTAGFTFNVVSAPANLLGIWYSANHVFVINNNGTVDIDGILGEGALSKNSNGDYLLNEKTTNATDLIIIINDTQIEINGLTLNKA